MKKPWWRTAALPRLRSRLDFMLNMNPLSAATRANTAFGWRFSGVLICCATAQRKNACILADQLRVVIPQMRYLCIGDQRLQPRTCRRKTRKARYAPIRRRSVPDSVFSRCGSLVGRGRMWAVRDVVSLHSCLLWGLVVEVGVLAVLWRFF